MPDSNNAWLLSHRHHDSESACADLLDQYDSITRPLASQSLPYQYQALPRGPYIRVLRLDPGQTSERLRCSLRIVSLDDNAQQYDALSYEWGTGPRVHTVWVDGGRLKIMENLQNLLIILRKEDKAVDLWADAICIDQASVTEKNHQVQQMRRVYQRSRTTHVFLPLFKPTDDTVSNLDAVLGASYWTRLWIIQEVILSSQIVVILGFQRIEWSRFIELYRAASDHPKASKTTRKPGSMLLGSTMLNLDTMRRFNNKKSLPALLRAYGQCNCSDVRDRVFGLLGLLEEDLINVDYGLSRRELFVSVLRALPPKYPGRLVNNLWHALELDADPPTSFDHEEQARFSMLLSDCGFAHFRYGNLVWSQHIERGLIPFCVQDDYLQEGDLLYSLSSVPTAELSTRQACLLILRLCASSSSVQMRASKKFYKIIGIAEIDRKEAEHRELKRNGFLGCVKDVSVYDDLSYGPNFTVIEMSLQTYGICRTLFEVNAPPLTAKLDWPTQPVEVIEL